MMASRRSSSVHPMRPVRVMSVPLSIRINESIKSYKIDGDELPTIEGKLFSMGLSNTHMKHVIFCDDLSIPIVKDMGILIIGNSRYDELYKLLHQVFTKITHESFSSTDDILHAKSYSNTKMSLYSRLKNTIIYCDEFTFGQVMKFLQTCEISKTLYIVCTDFSMIKSDRNLLEKIQPVYGKLKLYKQKKYDHAAAAAKPSSTYAKLVSPTSPRTLLEINKVLSGAGDSTCHDSSDDESKQLQRAIYLSKDTITRSKHRDSRCVLPMGFYYTCSEDESSSNDEYENASYRKTPSSAAEARAMGFTDPTILDPRRWLNRK